MASLSLVDIAEAYIGRSPLKTPQEELDAILSVNPPDKTLETLPCANCDPAKDWTCSGDGKMACSECKLVSYCSKTCQHAHWRVHKRDCRHPIRSANWEPAWVKEKRTASFYQHLGEFEKQLGVGLFLWGNTPAVDMLNLPMNEGLNAATSDFNLAFIASGDLRNVVRTINELPTDYSGHLTVLLNDHEPIVVLRNIVLLIALGSISDDTIAAEFALHFWYSAFHQPAHQSLLVGIVTVLLKSVHARNAFSLQLGRQTRLTGMISAKAMSLLLAMTQSNHQPNDARAEIDRVLNDPSRIDYRDVNYCGLQPSHRLASLDFRRFGLLLPFGAARNHFSTVNNFLFSHDGRWFQQYNDAPLGSWSIEDVVAAGEAHGVQQADLYGCLYFYVSKQLRSFAKRMKKFNISFHVFDRDAVQLAKDLHCGALGLPTSTHFDRIDVSNILDSQFVGIYSVLDHWAPLLNKKNRFATLLGYLMQWFVNQPGGEPEPEELHWIRTKLRHMGRLPTNPALLAGYMKCTMSLYDNSSAFNEYLKAQCTEDAARKGDVRLKTKHTIVPHRPNAPLGGPPNALPIFPSEKSRYLNVEVQSGFFSERFVEFSRL